MIEFLQFFFVLTVAVGCFFMGRNYERHHPRTPEEAKAAAELGSALRRMFKKGPK